MQGEFGLWPATYDGSTDAVAAGHWPVLAMKQYSDQGSVPGVAGGVDLDVFYGTEEQLRAYGPAGEQPRDGACSPPEAAG